MKTLNRNRDSRDDVYRSCAYESNSRYTPETISSRIQVYSKGKSNLKRNRIYYNQRFIIC